MSNGLAIQPKEFAKLSAKEQNVILYQNLDEIRSMVKGYKYELWTHRAAILLLFISVGAGKYLGFL